MADNYVRLLPALVIAVAAGGLGIKYLVGSHAATTTGAIVTAVQDLTTGGAANDANTATTATVVRPNDSVEYTVTVTNTSSTGWFGTGGTTLNGVNVTDTLPASMQSVTSPTSRTITLPFGDIPAGKSVSRKIDVKIVANAAASTVENVVCYATTAQLFTPSEKGCDSAFVRIAPVVVATTPPPAPKPSPAPTPSPSPTSKSPTPAAKTPSPAPAAATPSATPAAVTTASADCSTAADGTVKAGSAGADVTIPSSKATAVQVAYGTDSSKLDSKSALTTSKGDSTTVMLPSLKAGTSYSYQIIRQCSDGSNKTSNTSTFSTEKLIVNILYTNDDNDPLQGISSSFSCAEAGTAASDSTGLVTYSGIQQGDCKLSYNYQSKQCSNIITVPQPALSSPITASDIVTLTYKVKACAEQTDGATVASKGGLAGNKAALIFGILSLVLATLLVISYLKQHRSNNGPDASSGTDGSDDGGFTPPTDMPPSNEPSAAVAGYGEVSGVAAGYADPATDESNYAYGTDRAGAAPEADAGGDSTSYYGASDASVATEAGTEVESMTAPLPADVPGAAEEPIDQAPPLPAMDATPGTTTFVPTEDEVSTVAEASAPAVGAPAEAPAETTTESSAEPVDQPSEADKVAAASADAAPNDDGSLDIPHQPAS